MLSKLAKVAFFVSGTLVTFMAGAGTGAVAVAFAMSKASELSGNNNDEDVKDQPDADEE